MNTFLSTRQVAERLGVPRRRVSDFFDRGLLRDDLCPVVGRSRIIPENYIEQIEQVLRYHGHMDRSA